MTETRTMVQQIARWAKEKPDAPALHEMRGDGSWDVTTWADYWRTVRSVAKGFISLGLQPGEAVAIVGDNRREWVFCQHGITAGRGVPAPIYTTNTPEQTAYIVNDCKARIAVCDKQEQLDKYLTCLEKGLMGVEHVVTMDDIACDDPRVLSLAKLIERGRGEDDAELDARLEAVEFDDLALLIYTSGTTGNPKGAELTHRGIHATATATTEVYREVLQGDTRYVSYLPLCHAAEQGVTNFCGLLAGYPIFFCPDIKRIKDYLIAARPTVFFAVPRVWEKFEAALRGKLAEATGMKARLASWALETELEGFRREMESGEPHVPLKRKLARKLVIDKIKSALGLDDLRFAASGAAPISQSTLEFFASLGIVIHEGYGMTETTAFCTLQPYGKPRFGTVGRAFPGCEVRVADDGEILLRGENMIRGYLHLPEETKELYTDDGWLRTGDLGALDDDGFLEITGRKKDLIITAGGKNVAPAEMEAYLQGIPGVGQAVVVGDRRPYLCALLVLDPEALPELAKAAGVEATTLEEMAKDEKVRAFLEDCVERECNAKVARYQTIKKFEVLPVPFSVETGELTPTMKVKRNVVNDKYADLIAAMYAGGEVRPERPAPAA